MRFFDFTIFVCFALLSFLFWCVLLVFVSFCAALFCFALLVCLYVCLYVCFSKIYGNCLRGGFLFVPETFHSEEASHTVGDASAKFCKILGQSDRSLCIRLNIRT